MYISVAGPLACVQSRAARWLGAASIVCVAFLPSTAQADALAIDTHNRAALEPPMSAPREETRRTRDMPSPLNFILAGGLTAAAAVPLVAAIRTAIDHDTCAGDMDDVGRCDARVSFDSVGVLELVTGSTLLLVAVAVLVVQPLRLEVGVGREGALVRVGGSFQ